MRPIGSWMCGLHWGTVGCALPLLIALNCQLVRGGIASVPLPFHIRTWSGFSLHRSCACCHKCVCAPLGGKAVSLQLSVTSGSHSLVSLFWNDAWSLGGGSVIQMSQLWLSILKSLILCTSTSCRSLYCHLLKTSFFHEGQWLAVVPKD